MMKSTRLTSMSIAYFAFSATLSTAMAETITIATVDNGDMVRMQALTEHFTTDNPDITVEWVTLDENTLRQRATTDIATGGGQFDVVTIGTYEASIWAERDWLVPLDDLPGGYDIGDLLPSNTIGSVARWRVVRCAFLWRVLLHDVPHRLVRRGWA